MRTCVEAMSRSPQYWNSYSQNLREVATLCSAYRRWADIEQARDLYASTASSLSSFISQLKARESHSADLAQSLNAHYTGMQESLRDSILSFQSGVEKWSLRSSDVTDELSRTLRMNAELHSSALNQLAASVDQTIFKSIVALEAFIEQFEQRILRMDEKVIEASFLIGLFVHSLE
ncbi:hypothetical protein T439DRAFT_127842 [Meredithblackwellia eburnea MCA 4105]